MKKGQKLPRRLVVFYKGEKWKLHPGHKVFMINSNKPIGVVEESQLVRYYPLNPLYWLFYWRNGPYYQPKDRRDFVVHTTAKDRFTAVVRFKQMFRGIKTAKGEQYQIK